VGSGAEMTASERNVYAVRHGETEWSRSGRHTSVTDLPLTDTGRAAARLVAPALAREPLAVVMTSPLRRARETCELAGLGGPAEIDPDLTEWNYGAYEGLTSREIEAMRPGWMLFRDGCPGGETPGEVGARADRVIARVRARPGNAALFAHGHILRVLVARWIDRPAQDGQRFGLDTATLSVLGYYRDVPAVKIWNAPLPPDRGGASR
jgi:broad specificity phosphatase PhoE